MRYRTGVAAGVLTLGLAARLIALPLPGSTDLPVFALWADTAAAEGVGRMYGTDGVFPNRRLLARDGVITKVNYPPVVLYEFAAARRLRLPLKALSVIADAAITVMLWLAVRARAAHRRGGGLAALAYWINPAAILTGSLLGYVEPLVALPATAAVIAAASGQAVAAGALFAAAMLTKQLAVLLAPAILLALAGAPRSPAGVAGRLSRFSAAAVLTGLALCAQVVWRGGALNMAWSLAAPMRDPFLSGDAANLWWLVGLAPATPPLDALRAVGVAATIAAIVWSIAAAPRALDLWLSAAAGGLAIHAYDVLAVSVHEPHLFPAIPLLALAAAGRPRFVAPLVMVTAIVSLNVLRAGGAPMTLLAIGNCLALVWHARVYLRECHAAHSGLAA